MDQNFIEKARKAAGDIADRAGEAARAAGDRIDQFRESQRLNNQLHTLEREKQQCRNAMTDLLIRMFDQNTFAEALLKPDYLRLREIEAEMLHVKEHLEALGQVTPPAEEETDAPKEPSEEAK
jgi:hypothetical protein